MTASRSKPFAEALKRHLCAWARSAGLAEYVESGRSRPWVLEEAHRKRNLYREQWWRHIEGAEHRWARALNSSQCFGVNLFALLVDDPPAANRFLRKMLPDRGIEEADHVRLLFEHSPKGVPERLGERGQPTQIDVFFSVYRQRLLHAVVGIEVKLSEKEFGTCRGWNGLRDGLLLNPANERCLDGRRVFESPGDQCFMAEREGRRYWSSMTMPGASFDRDRLAAQDRCPFRHGLYQMMRNRVTLDVLRSMSDAQWCEFVVCIHPSNDEVRRLAEPVGGSESAIEAFRSLLRSGGILEWDASGVVDALLDVGAADAGWAEWMRRKYLLGPQVVSLAGTPPPQEVLAPPEPAPTAPRNDPPSQTVADLLFERELKKRCAAFLGVARRAGIEKIAPKIDAAFLGEAPEFRLRAAIEHQLRRWVQTNPSGRYADAIPAANSLYALLFDPDERARVEAMGLRLTAATVQEETYE